MGVAAVGDDFGGRVRDLIIPLVTTPPPTRRPALGPGWFMLSHALTGLLVLAMLGHLVNGVFSFWAWRTFTGWADNPAAIDINQATAYDTGAANAALVLQTTHLLLLVVLIVWLFRAHSSDRMDPAWLEHKSGWAIGGWFVPFLNLVRPHQMVEDVRRASQAGFVEPSNVVLGWWLSVIGAVIAERVTLALLNDLPATGTGAFAAIARANLSDIIASGLWVAASVFGVLMVREITQLVDTSPHAAPHRAAAASVPAQGYVN
ncbi:MAG: DUF4328 domain-containing protein [Nocardioides sp.]